MVFYHTSFTIGLSDFMVKITSMKKVVNSDENFS